MHLQEGAANSVLWQEELTGEPATAEIAAAERWRCRNSKRVGK
jgi:hypothetical protein